MIIPDKAIRERIVNELDKSFFVEAGAGSGKTRSLVDRMTALIVSGKANIEYIAAVTFTRKAAAELRERFQNSMEKSLSNPELDNEQKNNIHKALLNFDKTFIGTIHSFCARLLRERPIEAGVDPGFEEVAEEENTQYATRIWSEYIESERFNKSSRLQWIQNHDIKLSDLKNSFMKRVGFTDVEPVMEDIDRPDLTNEKKEVRQFLISMRANMPDKEPDKGWDSLQDLIVRAQRLVNMGFCDKDVKFAVILSMLNKKISPAGITLNRWPGVDAKQCREDFEVFRGNTATPGLRKWGEYLHKPLLEFVDRGVFYYERWRQERSMLNFQDLLMLTARLLEGNQEVRRYFRKHIAYLLVDEFQDTDPIQAQIIMLLTAKNDSQSCWYKAHPRPGSLFVVGDPKQSIFRFRRADIDIYNQVKKIFLSSGNDVLALTTNFRSLKHIGDLVNSTFKSIFADTVDTYQACFASLDTVRETKESYCCGILENPITQVNRHATAKAAELDADIIARWIKQALSGAIKLQRTDDEKKAGLTEAPVAGDFMIITRIKKNLVYYARALESLDIPYDLTGGQGFKDSQEIREIYTLLKAVCEPKNKVYLIAALRGVFFGVSDDALYQFKLAGGNFSYYTQVPKGFDSIEQPFSLLKECKKIIDSHAAVTAFEKIIDKLGLVAFAASSDAGATRCGNILKCLELLALKRSERIGGFSDILEYLKELLDQGLVEEMNLFPETSKVVRLMNLHKAKGLEANIVFLAEPVGSGRGFEPEYHVSRLENESKGYFVIMNEKNYHSTPIAYPPDWDDRCDKEKKYQEAEKRRLEYVAATRAKNVLVISTYRAKEATGSWRQFYSYLDNCEKLKIDATIDPIARVKMQLVKNELGQQQATLQKNIEKISEPTYQVATVTSLAKDDVDFSSESAGRGAAWGTIIHNSLEACAKGKRDSLELLIRNWTHEYTDAQYSVQEIIKLVDGIMQSPLWQRAQKAKKCFAEVPFSVKTDEGVLNGAIDLVFKEDDEWVIVDYKTDNFEKDPERKKAYQKQLDIYAKYWQELTGEKVKDKILLRV